MITPQMGALDPALETLRTSRADDLVSWMVGAQYFLKEDVQLVRGHTFYPDSPPMNSSRLLVHPPGSWDVAASGQCDPAAHRLAVCASDDLAADGTIKFRSLEAARCAFARRGQGPPVRNARYPPGWSGDNCCVGSRRRAASPHSTIASTTYALRKSSRVSTRGAVSEQLSVLAEAQSRGDRSALASRRKGRERSALCFQRLYG